MATKNIVPNTDGEGQLGTSSKSWAQGHIDSITGTIATAAQSNITSLGTLTTLTVDNVIVNGTTIGHTSDTDLLTLADSVLTVAGSLGLGGLAVGSYSSAGNDLVLGSTSSNNTGISIVSASGGSSNDSRGNIYFADNTNDTSGFITYLHTSAGEKMRFGVADTLELTITGSGIEISDSGTIGCASDTDLLTLASGALTVSGSASFTGNISLTGSASNLNFSSSQDASITMSSTASGTDGRDLTIFAGASSNTDADNGGDLLLRSGNAGANGSSQIKFITATASHAYGQQAEQMRIDSVGDVNIMTGNLVISTSGKGINFSAATDVASGETTASSTLDDYEEGTWTPTLSTSGGSVGTSSSAGQYTKIGRQVIVHFQFTLSSSSGGSGTLKITNLPFSVDANSGAVIGAGRILDLGQTINVGHFTSTHQIGMFKYNGNYAGTDFFTNGFVTYFVA